LVTLSFHGHIHGKAHDEVIVTVAGKGALNVNMMNGSDALPPFVLFAYTLNPLPTLRFCGGITHHFDTDRVACVQFR
jgi:hypothetical protein